MRLTDLLKRILGHLDYLIWASIHPSILEVGTGSGAQAIALSYLSPLVVSIDNDWSVLERAHHENQRFHGRVLLVCADARHMPFGDAAFGVCILQGFYEHLTDEELRLMAKEQLRVSPNVLSSVPSDHYPRQDYGNERLMPPGQWSTTLTSILQIDSVRILARYYHFDSESWLYSLKAMKRLGHFHEIIALKRGTTQREH